MVFKLIIPAFCNGLLAVILYLMEKKTSFGRINGKLKQVIIGILFGALAAFSTEYGVDVNGAVMNVRDASPLCAGLIFGAPAGLISGFIGGLYRYFAVFWGSGGTYTQVACSVATVLSGCIAAILRKYMFDNKKPSWVYGVGIGMICEIVHMLMIFLTNMNDASRAFTFVQKCTVPMVLTNGFTVGIAVFAVSLIGKEKPKWKKEQRQISQTFQFWLFVCIVVAFAVTSTFTFVLQTDMSRKETEAVISINLEDVHNSVTYASDKNLVNKIKLIKTEYLQGADVSDLAEKYNVIEVNIINNDGIIENTNNEEYIGYNMASGEQSAEFLVLLSGKDEYIQSYRPTAYDNKTYRKYGAITLSGGGFIQVGYDAGQFKNDINAQIIDAARNRHIGMNGFVVICDEEQNIVTDDGKYSGKSLSALGIDIDKNVVAANTVFEAEIAGKPHYCAYTFAEGYYIIGVIEQSEALFMRNVSIYVSIFMEMIIFAALFILIYFLIKKVIIDNLRKINNSLSQITDGNLNVMVDVRTNEEFASLSDDINHTVSTLKTYISEAAARIDKELEFAKQIQYSALPSVFPPYPGRKDFDIYARMITAKEVGGDFYDFYMLNDTTLAFLIADVSGKGIPAAMFMMRAKTIIKDLAESGLEIDEIFTKANKKLCENNDAGMFVTAWMGMLDLKTGLLKFVNAGHNPPLIGRFKGEFEYLRVRGGMVLAGMEQVKYRKNEIQLNPGDKIFLYTDGVTEATDKNSTLYGEDRLLTVANLNIESGTKELCDTVKNDVDSFVGEADQFDDITMLCVKLGYIKSESSITVIPDKNSAETVQSFVQTFTEKLAVTAKIANKVNILVDEVYSNIVNYSGADIASVACNITDGKLMITFSDNGIEYNPINAEEPDITLSAEERKIGGLGIFMVKKIAKSIEYNYEDNKNILTIVIAIS